MMIIECHHDGVVRIAEPLDFRRFKLLLQAGASPATQTWKGVTLLNRDEALVSIDLVPTLAGRPDDTGWDRLYAEMVTKAREHGWIDTEKNAIRAHIERIF